MSLKAYIVRVVGFEVSEIVFAADESDAKTLALKGEWFGHGEAKYVDLRVGREPRIDKSADMYGAGILGCDTSDKQRLMRDIGWYQFDNEGPACSECGYEEWSLVPESQTDESEVCAGCREERKVAS